MTHDAKLGQIIDNPEAARDAIHIALAPVTADTRLHPGQHVGLIGDGDRVAVVPGSIGIVDPFLTGPVNAGQRFWLFLYQNTITSLRHAWTHPAFEGESIGTPAPVSPAAAIASEQWLRSYAEDVGLSYGAVLSAADEWLESGEYHRFYGYDTPARVYLDRREFWQNWETVTGRTADNHDDTFFTCSC